MLVAAALAGCASKGMTEGRALIANGQAEAGLARLRSGLAEEPANLELKAYYHTQRERIVSAMLLQAQQDVDASRFDAAEAMLKRVIALHPENPRAQALIDSMEQARQHQKTVQEAQRALTDVPSLGLDKARLVLAQAPAHAGALEVVRQVQTARAQEELAPRELGAASRRLVTMEFRDAPVRNIFDMISKQSGINFIFDKDVRLDTKATLFARNTAIVDAINMILLTGQLAQKPLNSNTILIYPDQPAKLKQYQELMIKSFYLGNADAKSTMAMLRTLLKAKDIYVDDKLNLLIMRDTLETIRLAEKIIATQDIAEPEVMLDVEILEIKRGRLLDLGVQYPNQFSLLNLPPATTSTIGPGGVVTNTTPTAPVLTVDSLRGIARSQIAISPTPTVNVKKEDSDVNILANPRIRVKNREKAKIHIGDKVPVITSNATSTGVVSESVSYLDVGLKLDVEPGVLMRDDVQIKVGLEVSNIVREIRNTNGTLTYQIGTRNAGTTLRLKDGETQVLAGLISDEDRSAASRIPGLGDLPLLGRLFSSQRDERSKTEIVLLITPRVLRSPLAQPPALTEFMSGTESMTNLGFTPGPAHDPVVPSSVPAAPPVPPATPAAGVLPSTGDPTPVPPPAVTVPSLPPVSR